MAASTQTATDKRDPQLVNGSSYRRREIRSVVVLACADLGIGVFGIYIRVVHVNGVEESEIVVGYPGGLPAAFAFGLWLFWLCHLQPSCAS